MTLSDFLKQVLWNRPLLFKVIEDRPLLRELAIKRGLFKKSEPTTEPEKSGHQEFLSWLNKKGKKKLVRSP